MKQLKINNPCQEKWNEFEIRPQGGFCGACQKTVHDFTNKSNQEIKTILEQNLDQNLCGKIGVFQLSEFNDSTSNWYTGQSLKTLQSKFIWVLVITFGISLFSLQCANMKTVKGKMIYTEQSSYVSEGDTSKQFHMNADSIEIEDHIMGNITIEWPKIDTTPKRKDDRN